MAKPEEPIPTSDTERRTAQATLSATLLAFAEQIHNDDHYDPITSWIDVALIKQADLGSVKHDDKDWGHIAEEETPDTLNEDEDDDEVIAAESDETPKTSPPKKSKPSKPPSSKATTLPSLTAAKKLRPASDILNRLRWDASIDSADYLVGYDDRFVGAKEMPLDWWKMESSEEEFIPLHRIWYFRRKSDGEIIWERETKIDKVFGSGVGGFQV